MSVHVTVHNVIKVTKQAQEYKGEPGFWNLVIEATDADGNTYTVSFLSKQRLQPINMEDKAYEG